MSGMTGSQVSYPSGHLIHSCHMAIAKFQECRLRTGTLSFLLTLYKQITGQPGFPECQGWKNRCHFLMEVTSQEVLLVAILAVYLIGLFQNLWLKIQMICYPGNELLEVPWGMFQGDGLLTLGANTSLNVSSCCLSGSKSINSRDSLIWFLLVGERVKTIRIVMIIIF